MEEAENSHPFGFPFAPYGIQRDFMGRLHQCLDGRGIGFFESPTGTGKSLSLVCGLLSWLEEHRFDCVEGFVDVVECKDMLEAHLRKVRMQEALLQVDEQKKQREALRQAIAGAGVASWAEGAMATRPTVGRTKKPKLNNVGEEEWLLDDGQKRRAHIDIDDDDDHDDDDQIASSTAASSAMAPLTTTKVYYTSRTHTQLSQFISELRKTRYAPRTFVAAMGSRSTLCVHDPVKKLTSVAAINDACQDLRDKKGGCPCNKKDEVERLALRGLANVADIEDLSSLGVKSGVCSYFASRQMMTQADLVVLPYQMLFHKATREALGISLEGSIVVIDEAHNIIDAINAVHSVQMTADQLLAVKGMLGAYLDRYRARLSHANLIMLRHIESFVGALERYSTISAANEVLLSVTEFLFALGADNLNLFALVHWIRETRIAHVMRGFSGTLADASQPQQASRTSFHVVASFLEALTTEEGEGRILVRRDPTFKVEFLLLSPERCFTEMARNCRSIVLAGGTLAPIPSLASQLLSNEAELTARVCSFSCGHIVPPQNLAVLPIGLGPTDKKLDFSFKGRDESMFSELIGLLANVRRIVPGGLVVFFTSYAIESQFHAICVERNALSRMGELFRNAEFTGYSEAIQRGCKATLWAVIGGSLSEGINFNDDLGRCVVVVGVPYPNANDVVLKERLNRLGQAHYTALAQRALNQSIGRAIRHIDDYACVLLVDDRYSNLASTWLPSWMQQSLAVATSFGQSISQITSFFKKRGP